MVAKLIVEEGDLKGLSLSLEDEDTWTIGRDPDECQLIIEDPLVSRQHLIVRQTSEGISVENLSTTNPTLLNDEEMDDQPHLLQNGDTLKVGNEVLRFYEDTSAHIVDNEELNSELVEDENVPENTPMETPMPASTEENTPPTPPLPTAPLIDQPPRQDTIFDDENEDEHSLAEIDFGVIETGRWLLKVIGGPNNGAEFYMQAGNSYILGTDPQACDIVFHDTSVSRQHARITVTPEDALFLEDLKSRNGVVLNGTRIEDRQELPTSTIVNLGTTAFMVYDREGEMQTIISPLLPSIVKVLQKDPSEEEQVEAKTAATPESAAVAAPKPIETPPPKRRGLGSYLLFATILGLFVLAAVGTSTLFYEQPIVTQTQENAEELIQHALAPFPAVKWTFNKSSNGLLLLGHVATAGERNQLLYNLGNLKFIKNIDDSGIILDEGVLNEVNSLLSNNPAWKEMTIYSPAAGQFILSGELKTRRQAEQLSSYLSANFPYLDLLKKQIVVEEDIINQILVWLKEAQLSDVVPQLNEGEITLNGVIPPEKANDLNDVMGKVKQIPGVRVVTNLVRSQTVDTGIVNLSSQYPVTGKSRIGDQFTVVINGRFLSEGSDLDGMTITKITANRISLERNGEKFRIDY